MRNVLDKLLMKASFKNLRIFVSYYGHRLDKLQNMHKSMEYLDWLFNNKIEVGDCCEFGVASGMTMANLFLVSEYYKNLKLMRFIGFDSFAGLPKTDNRLDEISGWEEGSFSYNITEVVKTLKKAGLPSNRYLLIPGFYNESLSENMAEKKNIKKIAYAHIDCDYYSSTKAVLKFIKPYLIEGAIVDFDDYYCYPTPLKGEAKALGEWLDENEDIRLRSFNRYSTFGQSFTVSFDGKDD